MRKKLLLLVIVGVLVFSLSACDSGVIDDILDDGENDEHTEEEYDIIEGSIVGELSDDYLASSANVSSQNNGNPHNYIADEIWAFPIFFDDFGFIELSFLEEKVVFPIENNGNFNIEVDDLPDYDRFLFVLADSEAERRRDRIIDFVSIQGNNNLRTIPARGITEGIALGNLNRDNDEAVSSVRLEELRDRFMNYSVEDLEVIAHSDNALKALKNYYINNSEDSNEKISFDFSYMSMNDDIEMIVDKYNELDSYNWEYIVFNITTNMGDNNPKQLIPPADSNNSSIDLGISNDGGGYYSYFGTFEEEISEGFWTLGDSNGELGYFDFSFQLGFDRNDVPKAVVPTIKLNTDGDIVESISLNWYMNSSDGLTEISDSDILEELVMGAFVQFYDEEEDLGVTIPIEIDQQTTEFENVVESRTDLEWNNLKVDNFEKVDYSLLGIAFELFFNISY